MIGKALLERCITGKRDERVYLCEQEFALFAMYYFAEFFTYKIPGFQWLMYKALNEFTRGKFRFLLWIMFRESAKTTIAKIYVVYCIAYRKKRFVNWDAYDKGNAEAALFDIATWLQQNKRLIADFGQLFAEDPRASSQHKTMKRINEFITSNKVKVKAYSTQESTRGRIFDRFRPDLYVLEDFETSKTITSVAVTDKIIKHIDELKAGLSVDGQVLFLANLISDSGSVALLMQEAKANPGSWHVQNVPVVDANGAVSWPDKYVLTDEEAAVLNRGREPKARVVSLQSLRRDLNANGRKVFESEMMNDPEAADVPFFERTIIDAAIEACRKRKEVKKIGEFTLMEEYSAKFKYVIGADTAKGVGRDSCTSIALRLKHEDKVAAMIGGFYSDSIAPDMFGYELKSQGEALGGCLLAPELNNTGYATVTQLKALKYRNIYRQEVKDQLGKVIKDDLGWEATAQNVADIYYQFRTAFNDQEVHVWYLPLLLEMRAFTRRDLEESVRKAESAGILPTRHFDIIRAACIAWEVRNRATVAKTERRGVSTGEVVHHEYYGQ